MNRLLIPALIAAATLSISACGSGSSSASDSGSGSSSDSISSDTGPMTECIDNVTSAAMSGTTVANGTLPDITTKCFTKELMLPAFKFDLEKENPNAADSELTCGANAMYDAFEAAGGMQSITDEAAAKKLTEDAVAAVKECGLTLSSIP